LQIGWLFEFLDFSEAVYKVVVLLIGCE